jgi:hypothetical protein
MEDISVLFNKYGSDKDINGYSALYHTLFDKIRQDKLNVLEIGIGTMIPGAPSSMVGYSQSHYKPGGSLRAWRDYFVNSRIIGVDIQPDTQFSDDRIETHLCNSTKAEEVKQLMDTLNTEFDIIIDDGCHDGGSQTNTLRNMYPYLKKGGIYIIEDIYPGSSVTQSPKVIKEVVNNDPLFFVGLLNNQCVIYKNTLVSAKFC